MRDAKVEGARAHTVPTRSSPNARETRDIEADPSPKLADAPSRLAGVQLVSFGALEHRTGTPFSLT